MTAPLRAKLLVVQVSATAEGAKTPVNGINDFSESDPTSVNSTEVFMREDPYTDVVKGASTLTLGGVKIRGDAGQQLIRDAKDADPPESVFITILEDGENGFMREYLCTSAEGRAAAGSGFHGTTWQFIAQGPKTEITAP